MLTRYLHTGLSVENLDTAIKQYLDLGYTVNKQFEREDLKARAVHIVRNDDTTLELWEFSDPSLEVIQYIKNHIAIASDNLATDIDALVAAGFKIVIPITQGAVFLYAFVQDSSGNCIEIAQSD